MPWQEEVSFAALSDTAMAITGDISLSGDLPDRVLTTAGGAEIWLSFVEDWSSAWNFGDPEVWSGGIYAVEEDPGALENGNTLCGADPATYVVFTPIESEFTGAFLQLAVFSGDQPENIDSPGLCGTLNYALE